MLLTNKCIQCPYGHRENHIVHAVKDTSFCLKEDSGKFLLKHDHAYYYQVYS